MMLRVIFLNIEFQFLGYFPIYAICYTTTEVSVSHQATIHLDIIKDRYAEGNY